MDLNGVEDIKNKFRRKYGVHLTSKDLFKSFILPEIEETLLKHIWVDLFAGEGNLILPILNIIKLENRIDFFKEHIYLFDIHEEMVDSCIENAQSFGIPKSIAIKNISLRDNLLDFPPKLLNKEKQIYHITNPPYLYLGYIKKHKETQSYLKYFEGKNRGYQDLYQIAMMNDLRSNISNLIYIIPSNFIYGSSVSNKFRIDFLNHYKIIKMIIFEKKVFEFTGMNICVGFFRRKNNPSQDIQKFSGVKYKKRNKFKKMEYQLNPKYKYRSGSEFNQFIEEYTRSNSLRVIYYLKNEEISKNKGLYEIKAIDANNYQNNEYNKLSVKVNQKLLLKIKSNILFVRTVDTGTKDGKAGLGIIQEEFDVDGILVTGNTYRTHPIQIFLQPNISKEDQTTLKDYVNLILNFFRKKLDSEFLTTYKYSNASYTRKYLGLTQVKGLIKTYPFDLPKIESENLQKLISEKKVAEILNFLKIV